MYIYISTLKVLYTVVTRIKFCSYSGCVLTKDLNKSTGFKNYR